MDEQKPRSREEILAAIKAKADAIRAQRAAAAVKPEAPAGGPAAAAPTLEAFVSSVNAAGRPATAPQNPALQAYASVNYGVEITCAPTEVENLKKILGGIGAYQNPLRGDAFQIDYRYYAEARARLERAGYTVEERQFGPVPLSGWTPLRGGWSKVVDEKK
ncbi:MAG: hypothetical protein QN141_13290 [Armatimonadota bacterium]|nr:hypothetical protein [Armatimonadota bacterium]MDR7452427.1 hypothetical protein [Armatimonadota bacterium]MDR7468082.1 hypothetical protein [Armatimonadota bacterium]MDR7494652.1 hypothetical protein [Armatimonadota bacterium]MDR7500215.1 hypothetical protein [Armatimonadota bacterium]